MKKSHEVIGISASLLLAIMGILHLSGVQYFQELVQSSNLTPMVKKIFPVLFTLPSIQLIVLSALGLIETFSKGGSKKVFRVIALLVILNAFMAIYLSAWIPVILLLVPTGLFLFLSVRT